MGIERAFISGSGAKRLPRYFRLLRRLLMNGVMKISSSELSSMMNTTPSQVRADLNCFEGVGVQGYGYNVKLLYTAISRELGIADNMTAAVIGGGGADSSQLRSWLEGRGIGLIGTIGNGEGIYSEIASLDCDIAIVIDCPDEKRLKDALSESRIGGVWNMTQADLDLPVPVLNLPVGDIMLSLTYEIRKNKAKGEKNEI